MIHIMMIISYYVIVAHKAPHQYVVLLPQGYAICCITLTLQRIFHIILTQIGQIW